MKLHYSQTRLKLFLPILKFQYLMKLHYSQTMAKLLGCSVMFQYLMKLHYSQTKYCRESVKIRFQYLMKLHYSQTSNKLRHYNAQGNNIRYIYYTIYVSPSSITQRSLSTTYSFSPSQSLCGSEFSSIKKLICSRANAFNSSDISSGEK